MHYFSYKNDELFCESIPVRVIAEAVGTPFYLYSHATLTSNFIAMDRAFGGIPHRTCFSVKSCSNVAILRIFARLGGGVDIVSGGELFRSLRAGVDPKRIVYSGVGKTDAEMRYALKSGILLFNVESTEELERLNKVAAVAGLKAPVSFRVNPDIDPKTHPYISTGLAINKFGIDIEEAFAVCGKAATMPHVEVLGISCHIGSQITELSPFVESLRRLKSFVKRLAASKIPISYLDIGGGLGIKYDAEEPPLPWQYAAAIKNEWQDLGCSLLIEPGRVIVGNAAILVTRVLYTKETRTKNFVVVDAGMNDLARPSLYDAFHAVQPVVRRDDRTQVADLVGPICESGDFLARDREMPVFASGDMVAVMSAGAYGFSMSSNYNSRPRVAEVLVKDENFHVIRKRETYQTLVQGEIIPDFLAEDIP